MNLYWGMSQCLSVLSHILLNSITCFGARSKTEVWVVLCPGLSPPTHCQLGWFSKVRRPWKRPGHPLSPAHLPRHTNKVTPKMTSPFQLYIPSYFHSLCHINKVQTILFYSLLPLFFHLVYWLLFTCVHFPKASVTALLDLTLHW